MNITVITDRYYPIGGGIQQYLRGLCRQWQSEGHHVTFVTKSIEGCLESEEWEEGRIIRTPVLEDALQSPWLTLERWRELVPCIRETGADVVYANNHSSLAAIRACRHLKIPVVYCCHGWGLFCPLKIRLLRPDDSLCRNERSVLNCMRCRRMMLERGHSAAASTGIHLGCTVRAWREVAPKVARYESFQQIIQSAAARISPSRGMAPFLGTCGTFPVPYGIDGDTFSPRPSEGFRTSHGIDGDYVLVTSRVHNTKGQVWAVRALAHMPSHLKLVIAGNTTLFTGSKHENNAHTAEIRSEAERLGLTDRVVFTGFLATDELAQAYSGATATLVPSIWLDPFPMVTLEAMSCGCPVVVTDCCGTAEMVSNGVEGYVVPRMNPMAIAAAVANIIARREAMGVSARHRMQEELNWPAIAARVLRVLKDAIEQTKGRRHVR